ncbi:ATP-binding protein [Hydrocarboniclastica marina]|uniref:Sensor protein n=1 Tax=Hydrocarboniclastica marina TaxID=2259620 RepID=A0A4P7XK59_9ALTE|nr:ATP-binding protein [Hydrocarboniclastica marina]MAM00247.1 histidine kinase [Alteromonadaceae bacterium]QCF27576.1 HAMP domain-containing protein [Hydrocarboniclastica marina]
MFFLQDSLIRRMGLMLAAISLVALVNIGLSFTVSQSIEGSATAINMAGSLRKQLYFSLAQWHQARSESGVDNQAARIAALDQFDQRLAHNELLAMIPDSLEHPTARQYATIVTAWRTDIRPMLARPAQGLDPEAVNAAVADLTVELESLVALLEERTESRIQLMNLVQGVSLVFTVLAIALMLYDIRNNIVRPLRRLLGVARAVAKGDFSQNSGLTGTDELNKLGQALDQMTEALEASYQGLENRVEQKTRELARSHSVLELLHGASRSLYSNGDLCEASVPLLQQMEDLLGIGPIKLYLHDRNAPEPVEVVTTASKDRPFYCRDHSCNACLITPQAFEALPNKDADGKRLLLPIRTASHLLGTLEVWYPRDQTLPDTSRRLLETLSDQLATAVFLQRQITEQQRLTLAEERAVIARELHDSLAQSLSYLKIQVARLRKLEQKDPGNVPRAEVLDELSTGLNSAYRQLRELLTTFRLKLDTPDLGSALRETVAEFGERFPRPVSLVFDLPPQLLTANEEIHVLQIVREALSNAVKHSEADSVEVSVQFRSPRVWIQIADNGRGLPEGDQPPQHYGLIIMQDRARTLGGEISVGNREGGGVAVTLSFLPVNRNLIATQVSA